jgi:hypothetical protein
LGAALSHAGAEFFLGVTFATRCLGTAVFQARQERSSAGGDVCLGFDQIERVGKQFDRLAEASGGELLLEATLGGGIEGDGPGMSIESWQREGNEFSRYRLCLHSSPRQRGTHLCREEGVMDAVAGTRY